MPKRIRDLATGNATPGHFLPADPPTGSTYKTPLGRPGGVAMVDPSGYPLDGEGRRVVSSGSNSNGWFVRFSDGTQICWALHTTSTFGGTSGGNDPNYLFRLKIWVYPATFSAPPAVTHSGDVHTARAEIFGVVYTSPTQALIEMGQYNAYQTVEGWSSTIAIGRWY